MILISDELNMVPMQYGKLLIIVKQKAILCFEGLEEGLNSSSKVEFWRQTLLTAIYIMIGSNIFPQKCGKNKLKSQYNYLNWFMGMKMLLKLKLYRLLITILYYKKFIWVKAITMLHNLFVF